MRHLVVCGFAFLCLCNQAYSDNIAETSIKNDITYVFYSRQYFDGVYTHINDDPKFVNIRRVFKPSRPTVILIHGYLDGYGADSNTFVREAILSKTDANIIKVDWSPLAGGSYFTARDSVPLVGDFAGRFIQRVAQYFNYPLTSVTVVGFSLGAHVAGNLGRAVNGKLGVIIALDPAGPFIDNIIRVRPSDALYVQSIHTNGGTMGLSDEVGHSDFYPNGGSRQPGCGFDIIGGCAHNRAWEFFAESVTSNRFVSQKCANWNEFNNNRCNGEIKLMGGLTKLDKTARGSYYLRTNSQSPFGQH